MTVIKNKEELMDAIVQGIGKFGTDGNVIIVNDGDFEDIKFTGKSDIETINKIGKWFDNNKDDIPEEEESMEDEEPEEKTNTKKSGLFSRMFGR